MEEEEQKCEECPPCKKGAPAWMATFADMATLLMAFFVLILSFAEMNVPKFKMITGSLKNAFGVQQLIPVVEQPKGTTIIEMSFSPNPTPAVTEEMRQDTTDTVKPEIELQQKDKDSDHDVKAEEDAKKVSEALAEEIAKGQVEVRVFGDRVVVQFTPQEVTEENKPQLEKETQNALKKVLNAAAEVESPVKMSGLDPATMGISTAASDKPEKGAEGQQDESGSLGRESQKGLESPLDELGVNKGSEQSDKNSQDRTPEDDHKADSPQSVKPNDTATQNAKSMAVAETAAQAAAQAVAEALANGKTEAEAKQIGVDAGKAAADAMAQGKTVAQAMESAKSTAGVGDRQKKLDKQQKKLQSAMQQEIAQGLVKVERRDGKLKVTVGAGGAFPSGGAELTPQARQIIAKLGQVIQDGAARVEVSGHTDNVPLYYSDKFRDNWDLAAARASSVLQEIGNSSKLELSQMRAVSYGESKPIESNDKPEGREKNRRIEIDVSY